jgi:hypothetical protein
MPSLSLFMVMLVISAGREANDKMGRDYRIL